MDLLTPSPELAYKDGRCARCGAEMGTVGGTCLECLTRFWWETVLARQRALLRADPRHSFNLAFDPEIRAKHVALVGQPATAFCGAVLKQAARKRTQAPADKLPAESICAACRAVVERIKQEVIYDVRTT